MKECRKSTLFLYRFVFTRQLSIRVAEKYVLRSETATGHTQWDMPGAPDSMVPPPFPVEEQNAAATAHHSKKRQYAAGQTQAYQGTAETVPQYSDPSTFVQPGAAPGGQLFTPGLSGESSGFQQQQATTYFSPDVQYPGGQQHATGPPYQQQAAPMNQLGDQFGQMNLQGGQKSVSRYWT